MRFGIGATAGRTLALVAFFAAVAMIMYFFYSGTGAKRPFIDSGEYTATVKMKDVDNLVMAGQVQIAGVRVGQVRSVERLDGGGLEVEFALDDEQAPLHEGAQLRLAERSLVGETYLALTDGKGAELPSGTELPEDAVEPSVQLRDVLASVDEQTRGDLRSLLRSLGEGTSGTKSDTAALLTGMGNLGREGHTALDAIAAQSSDLTALARETTQVLAALDTGQGQIASLVKNANRLTASTAGQRQAIEDTLRLAPGVLDTASTASGSLESLATALLPVATDLRAAGPDLSLALRELPSTTTDLRRMLPSMSGVLDKAPATLKRVPTISKDLQSIIPTAQATLADVNPMLAYVKPYGPELAAYFANFNAVLNYRDESGAYYLRLTPLVNTHSPGLPISTDGLLGNYTNPYPAPGTGATPGPFKGDYPRVERDGR
ncbi:MULTISPECIES: MlaD family protein [unclassified Nocardioides]|uniref:MlaD family protein n=1 Tax=unclassified Nocardioides TaxID=2615069 RepID=UPI0006FF53B8|nr:MULTISPECIES: MlaD family protein [unclassified Nocardioides]KQY57224.1 oxidoreductase [Nocardioides sp. Root140]KQZ68739.1 oxidoreductase [Nocardioides sp. Root151]KRF11868.1 oxidoreductase [Nocardioides sp. Soil796]